MEINGLMIKSFIYVAIIFMLGVSVLSSAEEEKHIWLECKVEPYHIDIYERSQTYRSCVSENWESLKSKFPNQNISQPSLIGSSCLLDLTLKTNFKESFIVDKKVSNLFRKEDGSLGGSIYYWDFESLFYMNYFSNGKVTYFVDRSDLSYDIHWEPKSEGDHYSAHGQCSVLKDERKI